MTARTRELEPRRELEPERDVDELEIRTPGALRTHSAIAAAGLYILAEHARQDVDEPKVAQLLERAAELCSEASAYLEGPCRIAGDPGGWIIDAHEAEPPELA